MAKISEHKQKQLDEMSRVIDYIITSTHHWIRDEKERQKIAAAISRSIVMSKNRGGDVLTPEDTNIYKIAYALKDATTFEDFKVLLKGVKKMESPLVALSSYGLKWKTKFELPANIKEALEPKKIVVDIPEHKEPEVVQEKEDLKIRYIEPEVQAELDKLTDALTITRLQLVDLHEFIRLHSHTEKGDAIVFIERKLAPFGEEEK